MPSETFPCLSVRQPWADLIVDGRKDVENRTWPTEFRGFILIHAPLTVDEAALKRHDLVPSDYVPVTGAIVGFTEIVNCVTQHRSRFFEGPFGFVLANSRRFPDPIPLRGRLGIFPVPAHLIRDRGYALPTPRLERIRS